MLSRTEVTFSADYWALGCIIYQMISGLPPFRDASEYLIFQRVCKGEYTFPFGFPETPRDLVQKLLHVNPRRRLGSLELGGAAQVKVHDFFGDTNWSTLLQQVPPQILPYLPASGDEPELRSTLLPIADIDYDNVEPGLDNQLNRLHGLGGLTSIGDFFPIARQPSPRSTATTEPVAPITPKASVANMAALNTTSANANNLLRTLNSKLVTHKSLMDVSPEERKERLKQQRAKDKNHRYVNSDHLILKSGFIEKKVGFFARNRMFLLTDGRDGPHLYYVDVNANECKGEVPMKATTRTEAKNFRTFFVHTPGRTYYLTDRENNAQSWCDAIDDVLSHYFASNPHTSDHRSAAVFDS